METVFLDVVYYIYILLFGAYVSIKIACGKIEKKEWQVFCFTCPLLLLLQGVGLQFLGLTTVRMLYPLITHLPILLVGLLAGPLVGGVAGAVAPLLSFALTGMPALALLPFMVMELFAYGLVSGLMARVKMPTVCRVIVAQIAGRALRAVALLVAVFGFSYTAVPVAIIWNSLKVGLLGMLLQLVLIPLVLYRVERDEH